ncbi:MAG: hypothetical protein KJN93_04360 [Alphaproteobacteria bacterium]|nr:hypothetical protein [Alphaproteobacteria bacterium]NNF23367.1 hypothetical protein [Paracoccaceae bacterium]
MARRRSLRAHAPPPRPTFLGALLLAIYLSLPVFAILSLAELAWRAVF